VPAIVTGKPEVLGGTAVRRDATGLGVVICLEAILEYLGWELSGSRVALQGCGKVGAVAAREVARRGARIVAVTDVAGGVANERGLDLDALDRWVGGSRFIRGFPEGEPLTREQALTVPCDLLIPAALEHQITADNAAELDCKLVLEAANGPTTPEADRILGERQIPVVPDLLANGGGVAVSYYEWAQDIQREAWTAEHVLERLRRQINDSVARVLAAAERWGVDWRTAAQGVGIEPVAEASEMRAVYP
jgi:glutamate dehydrogenase (NAD(P)+)